ncbi:hypothetical protein GF324_02125, partial [bacterium]|nr:hypothetical protein [bacterium]
MVVPAAEVQPFLMDGGMGTTLQDNGYPPDRLSAQANLDYPELVRTVHARFIDAGAEILLSNTFGLYRKEDHPLLEAGVALLCEAVQGTDLRAWISCGPFPPGMNRSTG